MDLTEYLVSYGPSGEFGRFAPQEPLVCARGDRVVVKSRRGIELGTALCPVTTGHVRVMGAQPVRPLLRRATPADEARAFELARQADIAFDEAHRLVAELGLPLDIVDVESLAEPRLLVVHFLGDKVDYRSLVSSLSRRFDTLVEMQNVGAEPGELAGSCGSCGSGGCGEGGCGSCGSGGCSTQGAVDLRAYFTQLRMKMAQPANGHI
jgi:cell fate regulator YaaT (PSP1 superfamily)